MYIPLCGVIRTNLGVSIRILLCVKANNFRPVSWIYPPELFPTRVRGKAVALCTAANWVFNFALSYFVPPAFVNIQWKTYIIFGVFCTVMTIHVFFAFPETSGKTLEEVEEIFITGEKPWKTKVQTNSIRAVEQGILDEEKMRHYSRHISNAGARNDSSEDDRRVAPGAEETGKTG